MEFTKVLPSLVPMVGINSNLDNPENPGSFSSVLEEELFAELFLSLLPKQEGQSFEENQEMLNESNFNPSVLLQSQHEISKDAYFQKVAEHTIPWQSTIVRELEKAVDISRMILPDHLESQHQKGDGFDKYRNNIVTYLNALAGKIMNTTDQVIQPSNNMEFLQKLHTLLDNERIKMTQPIVDTIEDPSTVIAPDKTIRHTLKEGIQENPYLLQEKFFQQPKSAEAKVHVTDSNHEMDVKIGIPNFSELAGKHIESPSKTHVESILSQIAQGIRHNVQAADSQVKKLNIQLSPAELGNIEISLRWQDGQVHLNFKASEIATHNNLQNNFSVLREALESMGVSCGSMEMGFSEDNSRWNQPHQKSNINGGELEVKIQEEFTVQPSHKVTNNTIESIINVTV